MTKDDTHSSTLIDWFGSASHDEDAPRQSRRSFSKKAALITGSIALAVTAGIIGVVIMSPNIPHAEQIGVALSDWSEQNGGVEIPESDAYISYHAYLKNLGPRSAEFGLPNFGGKSQEIMVKVVQSENPGSPFTVCSYDMSAPKETKKAIKEYTYYSFNSEAAPIRLDDPTCIPNI